MPTDPTTPIPGGEAERRDVERRVKDTLAASRTADLAGDGGRILLGLTTWQWEIVLAALRSLGAGDAEAMRERTDICSELGCIDKPGVPLRFVRDLRRQLSEANARNGELIRSWDKATPTERQELDRMRRGWGPSSPTERVQRRSDVLACIQILSIVMSDLTVGEGDDVPEDAQKLLDEAYERVSKAHGLALEVHQAISIDPEEWPDIQAAEERGAMAMQERCAALIDLDDAPMALAIRALPLPTPRATETEVERGGP